jgi:radical SAM superfamily enzyme YgiQ (UPF0313 family)
MQKMQPYPPLQTMIAAAYLREKGFDVALFDTTLNAPEQGFRNALAQYKPKLIAVCEDSFNFIAKMCLKRNRETAWSLAAIAREFDIPIVISSPDASDRAFEYLSHGADFAIIGEPENTLLEIARHVLGLTSGDVSQIPGLCYADRATGKTCHTAPREPEIELNHFPVAAWDLIDVPSYRNTWINAHGFFCLNMVSSRGCPYSCNWCAKPIFGQSYRHVSARRAAEEMKYLKQQCDPDQIWFADDIFALSPQWINRFGDEIRRMNAQIPFEIQSRCDLITGETASALQGAGCIKVWMGAESGSQRILDAMEKNLRVEEIYTARNILKRHGIRAGFFLQFGYPGETWKDIQSTIQMVRETVPDDVGISVSYPLPGTKFYNRVAAEVNANSNWLESGDLSVIFHATYRSEFYSALHDALHLEVDALNGRNAISLDCRHLHSLWTKVHAL